MNTLTLTIEATPENLKKLAEAFKDEPAYDVSVQMDKFPPVPETAETVAKPAENVAKPGENVATPTLSDIRIKAAEAVKAGHGAELKALLDKYEVEKVPNLPEEKYAAFFADLEAIK